MCGVPANWRCAFQVYFSVERDYASVLVEVLLYGETATFEMDAAGSTVLEAGRNAGLDLPYSCEAGSCSTCRARLIQGRVRMLNNLILDDAELAAGYILACQSIPESDRLMLDFDA